MGYTPGTRHGDGTVRLARQHGAARGRHGTARRATGPSRHGPMAIYISIVSVLLTDSHARAWIQPTIATTLSTPSGGGSHHHLLPTDGAKGIRPHKSSTSVAFSCAPRLFLDTSSPRKAKQQAVIPIEASSACLCTPPSNHSIRPASPCPLASPARQIRFTRHGDRDQSALGLVRVPVIDPNDLNGASAELRKTEPRWPWLLHVARWRWRSS